MLNDLQSQMNPFNSIQQNQYSSGQPSSSQNSNTGWMDQTNNQPQGITFQPDNSFSNTGINGGADWSGGSGDKSMIGNGTAISAVANGWNPANGQMPGSPIYGNFQLTPGYNTDKLNDPNKHDPKYDWLRSYVMAGSDPNNLQKAVDYYNQTFGQYDPQATYSGSGDKIDFGQGTGLVDVLFGHGAGINSPLWAPQGGDNSSQQNNSGTNMLQWLLSSLFGGNQQNMGTGGGAQLLNRQSPNNFRSQFNWNQMNQNPNGGLMPGVTPIVNNWNPQPYNGMPTQPYFTYSGGFSPSNSNGGMSYLGGVQQPQLDPATTLQQMWAGTYKPYTGPQ